VQPEEGKDPDQQAGHAEKDRVQQRIILAVERVGVGLYSVKAFLAVG